MSLVDIGILLFAITLAAIGYERGLLASALPLAGFVCGAALGARVGPALLADGAQSEYAPIVAVATGVLIGAFAAVTLDGVALAVRARLAPGPVGVVDGIGGAIVLAALALLLCWALGAVALHVGGEGARDLREAVQRSAILGGAERPPTALGAAAQRATTG